MILELLKQAIKTNDLGPVREAYKLISGKEFISANDMNVVKVSSVKIDGENNTIETQPDQFVFTRKTEQKGHTKDYLENRKKNKFSPVDYTDVVEEEETHYKPPVPRTRKPSSEFNLQCKICNRNFTSVIQESICSKCVIQ